MRREFHQTINKKFKNAVPDSKEGLRVAKDQKSRLCGISSMLMRWWLVGGRRRKCVGLFMWALADLAVLKSHHPREIKNSRQQERPSL
jgi:hypothetical protein